MTVRKLLTGFVAVAGVLAFTADAQAFGKRKKNKGCDSCATVVPVSTGCGGGGGCGVAYAGVPDGHAVAAAEAMPSTGTATNIPAGAIPPASDTTGGPVVPASGATVPQNVVIPAGGYTTAGVQYVQPAGYTPVVQPSGTTSSGRRGIFRR